MQSLYLGDTEYMSDELTNLANEFVRRLAALAVEFPDVAPHVEAGLYLLESQNSRQAVMIGDLQACDESQNPSRDLVSVVESSEAAWTVQGLAKLLSLSPRGLYDLVESGSLPAYRIGTAIRLCPATTAAWLRERLTVPS
jgi:excisionase family DNA binding protein